MASARFTRRPRISRRVGKVPSRSISRRGIGSRRGRGEAHEEVLYDIDRGWNDSSFAWTSEDLLEEQEDGYEEAGDLEVEENVKLANLDIPRRLLNRLERSEAKQRMHEDKQAKKRDPKRKARQSLRIVAGKARGIRLLAAEDNSTRPMMENVREAVFDMLLAHESRFLLGHSVGGAFLGRNLRWLDLFAGTGSVGIEALSRGIVEAHFVELDPWCVNHVLRPNLTISGCSKEGVVHMQTVENFMENASMFPQTVGGTFDFISITPPYPDANFTSLLDMVEASPLVHPATVLVIEYPKKAKMQMRDECGPLIKFRDRKYGRTHVAIYGPREETHESHC